NPNDHLSFKLFSLYVPNAAVDNRTAALYQNHFDGVDIWCDLPVPYGGLIFYNHGNKTVEWPDEFQLPPGLLVMHPADNYVRSCIRFTVPADGRYSVNGYFYSPGVPSNPNGKGTTDVHFSINNVEQQSFWINSNGGSFVFPDLHLNYGDFVHFEVGWGINNDLWHDSTITNLTIIRFT
ncbi:unnamed protein product, partial [Didymodactylos carnosus]